MNINFANLIRWLKFSVAPLSVLVLVFDAASIAKWNSYFSGYGYSYGGGLGPNNALLAACILNMIYFGAALWFLYKRPESIFISVMVDTICLGFLFLFNIGCVGSVTSLASAWSGWYGSDFSVGPLTSVTAAFGWVLVLILGTILGLEVYITLKNYGTSLQTWKTPLHILMSGHTTQYQQGVNEEGKIPVTAQQSAVSELPHQPQQAQQGFQQQPATYQSPTV